jgi:hypothetical protein
MEKLLPRLNLYVGRDEDYEKHKNDPEFRFARCCKYGPGGHQQTLGYKTLAAPKDSNYLWVKRPNRIALNLIDQDDPGFIPEECIEKALEYIKDQLDAGKKVIVCCNSGHSRGPTTALLFLRTIGEMPHSFVIAERIYRTLYPPYSPGQGMRQRARQMWDKLENKYESNT